MFESLKIQYPQYFIALCLLLGIFYALSLYFRNKKWKDHKSYVPTILGVLRTIAVAWIAYFLLVPILERFKQRTQQAIVVIASDASSSISEAMDSTSLATYQSSLKQLKNDLGADFKVETFQFGETIRVTESDTLDGMSTDISKAFEYIEEQYNDQHIGAILMATDGIFNEGRNPLYVANDLSAPLYPIALGDTTIKKDIVIKNLLYNKIAYLGDKHEIQADIQATNVIGAKSTVTLYKVVGGKRTRIDEQSVSIKSNDFFKTLLFKVSADAAGAMQYVVTVSGVANELSTSNNAKTAYIDVIDARQEIFIIANAPHPDIHALRKALELNKNYKISQYIAGEDIPIAKADVTLFHNLPSPEHNIDNLLSTLNKNKKSRIYITGPQTDLKSFNGKRTGLSIQGVIGQSNESQANVKSGFNKFTLSEKLRRDIGNYPPLLTPFGEYTLSSTADKLLVQKINGIQTQYPLLAFDQSQGIRTVYICGEGLWKWRLFNYLQDKNHQVFDELIKKTAQFASVKDDKRKFRVNIAKNDYKVNEEILLDAQLYNDVYELINTPEASLTIKNSEGKSYDYTFTKSNNYYTLNAGALTEGSYTYIGKTNHNGKNLTSSGKFRIESIQKESYNLTADHGLLYQLAEKYKGKVYLPNQVASMAEEIKTNNTMKPVVYQEKDNRMLMHYPWLLLPIILLLGIEWFYRRYSGGY